MKVEQRIGRIDRISQEYADIYVLNLCMQIRQSTSSTAGSSPV